ncbi:integrase core domain-containing protein, partial [Nesterenkonia halobia]|uniref:Integrase catalytic domain-containing protein n=1 Tax=Nesterenkonia halobia TaxID=37922 RepID=A0ABP6RN20_9MICC
MVYTTRLAGGAGGTSGQPNGFEHLLADLGIVQKNGQPHHPTTQGKVERFHPTLKLRLDAQPPAATLAELDDQLAAFRTIYNTTRPHRGLGRRTPASVYHARPPATPALTLGDHRWRTRYDIVGANGTISLRYADCMRHLAIGRSYSRRRVLVLIHHDQTMVIDRTTGEIIAEHRLDPARSYQPKTR